LVQGREYFGNIEKAAQRLHDELLIILDEDGGGRRGAPSAVRLIDLMDEVCGELAIEAQRAGITIDLEVDRDLRLWTEERVVWRIVSNLMANAVKYNRPDGSVTVSASKNRAGGIEVTVSDTGIGMDPNATSRIFAPYTRLDADAAVQNRDGKGLGLAIVGDLAKRLGAVVAVESQPGKGSKFVVKFPSWRTIGKP